MERIKPHDLLHVPAYDVVHCEESGATLPEWARRSLRRAPWMVVRRAYAAADNFIPVGVRGDTRGERLAAFVDSASIVERLTPESLLAVGRSKPLDSTPALRAVGEVDELLCGYFWGPTGSVGFELASGLPTTNAESDLDVVIRAPNPVPLAAAIELSESFAALPVRVDAQLDTPSGAVSLQEYTRGREVLVRTVDGPKLIQSPWRTDATGIGAGGRTV